MSLKTVQKQVDDWVQEFSPPYWPVFEQLARLVEEVGELSRELQHRFGEKKKKVSEEKKELGEEIADVLFTLVCIANKHGIDLETEWQRTMKEKQYGRDKHRFTRKEDG